MDENGDKVTAEIVDSEAIQSTSSSAAIINTGVDQREDEIPQEQEEEGDEIPLPSNIMAEDETTTLQTSEANGIDTDRSSLNTGRMIKDRFGFIITESDISHQRLSLTAKELQLRKNKESERAGKWIFMMRKWTVFDHSSKLKSRVRKGIPDALRSFAWKQLAENDKIRTKYPVPTLDIDTSALSASVKDEVIYN